MDSAPTNVTAKQEEPINYRKRTLEMMEEDPNYNEDEDSDYEPSTSEDESTDSDCDIGTDDELDEDEVTIPQGGDAPMADTGK